MPSEVRDLDDVELLLQTARTLARLRIIDDGRVLTLRQALHDG